MAAKFNKPPFLVAKLANPLINLLVRLGLRPGGAATLIVKGRKSGKDRRLPVNPLAYEGATYLVAPRGTTEWARNLRAAGEATLRIGRTSRRVTATEVPVAERAPIIRAYLDRWKKVTASQFGVRGDESVEELESLAADHPVFRLEDA